MRIQKYMCCKSVGWQPAETIVGEVPEAKDGDWF